jgi:ribonucleoside-diphosphate reductase alpha chain
MRVGKNEALYKYVKKNIPELVEDCIFKPHLEAIVSIPQKAPQGAILRNENVFEFLSRVKKFNLEWVRAGHNSGANYNNVSCTVSIKDDEWSAVGDWMWNNREYYTGISVIPYNGGSYKQAPFEDCTKEVYDKMFSYLKKLDLSQIIEDEDNTSLKEQVACAGGACEISF